MENDITTEVSIFDTLVKKTDGFNEKDGVVYYGMGMAPVNHPLRILSNLCMVCGEGIKYTINGKQYVFDTLEHLYTFLVYGVPTNMDPWVRGGVLNDFVKTFGDDAGLSMVAKYHDMTGIIPQLIIKKGRADLRASHGILLKSEFVEQVDETTMHYDFWRPLLLAKFAHDGPAKDALLSTDATTYLIEKPAMAPPNMEWSGKIVFPEPVHDGDVKAGCTCGDSDVATKSCMLSRVYMANKKAGTRVLGVLQGNNRMGKYLMAIRSEVRLLNGVGGIVVKREKEDPPKTKKKSKKTHTFQV